MLDVPADYPPELLDPESLCSQTDPELWFPEKGGNPRLAKAVCARCPLRLTCAQWGIDALEPFGIWGGLTYRKRRSLRGRVLTLRELDALIAGVDEDEHADEDEAAEVAA